jgi:hypothetical protein
MVIGLFIPCYIEAVFQEAGIAAVGPRCRLPARPGLLRPADGRELEYARRSSLSSIREFTAL